MSFNKMPELGKKVPLYNMPLRHAASVATALGFIKAAEQGATLALTDQLCCIENLKLAKASLVEVLYYLTPTIEQAQLEKAQLDTMLAPKSSSEDVEKL